MKKTRLSAKEIVKTQQSQESCITVKVICMEYGINESPFYNSKGKYCGKEVSDIKCTKNSEDEYARLKNIKNNLTLVIDAVQCAAK
jgi:hypothetical protein